MFTVTIPRSILPKMAKILATNLKAGDVVGLAGPLGVGKTTLIKLVGKELGARKSITSPTFTLINSYPGKLNKTTITIHHADLYRINSAKEAMLLGFEEILKDSISLSFIEWADKFPQILPKHAVMLLLVYE